MIEVRDPGLELDMVLADAIAEGGISVEEAMSDAEVVAELGTGVEDMEEVVTSVVEIMVAEAALEIVDVKDKLSSMDEVSLELATCTAGVDGGDEDGSTIEVETRVVEDLVLESTSKGVITKTEVGDALRILDSLLKAVPDEGVKGSEVSDGLDDTLLDATTE
jgi:hypothetical protein